MKPTSKQIREAILEYPGVRDRVKKIVMELDGDEILDVLYDLDIITNYFNMVYRERFDSQGETDR